MELIKKKIPSMTNEAYHAHAAISKSKLDLINKSIAHFLHNAREEKTYFNFGSAVHDAILLPELFEKNYVCMPETIKIRRGKEWDAFKAANADKTILTADEYDLARTMRDRILSHKICSNIFTDGEPEHSYFDEISVDGVTVQRKCRPDFVSKSCLIDIKTTQDASYDAFKRAILKYRYHVQAAWYLDVVNSVLGTEIDTFIFVAIEKEAPFPIAVYMLDRESLDLGRKQYEDNLKTYAAHMLAGQPQVLGYTDEAIQMIGCPNYAFYEEIS
jgi:exodeoxyribonuclease VIII